MSQQAIMYAVGIAILVLAGIILIILYKKKHPTAKDNRGRHYKTEKAVHVMRRFARSNRYRFLAPVELGENTRIDAVIIGEFGILGVKAYGYNREIYGSADEKEWLRVGHADLRETFPNPVMEANRDVQALRSAVQKSKVRNVSIEVVPVFTNPKAELAVARGAGHLTLRELKSLLGKDKYQQEKGVDTIKVEQAIREAMGEKSPARTS